MMLAEGLVLGGLVPPFGVCSRQVLRRTRRLIHQSSIITVLTYSAASAISAIDKMHPAGPNLHIDGMDRRSTALDAQGTHRIAYNTAHVGVE